MTVTHTLQYKDFATWHAATLSPLADDASAHALLSAAWEKLVQHAETNPEAQHAMQCGLNVVEVLSKLHVDEEALTAAMLYPSLSLQGLEQDEIEKQFGKGVSQLLDALHQMDTIKKLQTKTQVQADKLRRMLLAMADDVRGVVIKLAQQVCEVKDAKSYSPEKAQQIAKDCMDVYAPLANRLGIAYIKWELEDLAFRILQAEAYSEIAGSLAERRLDREAFIEEVIAQLSATLGETGITAEISGRAKHIFSIWRKMRRKNLPYSEIFDVHAVRILVDDIQQCYAALGCVHALWQHIPKEFDDYIATPKENGYRSLHTAVIGPGGRALEVQIRTHEMHEESELGVAAHWHYKESGNSNASKQGQQAKVQWLRHLLEWQKNLSEEDDVEALKELQSQAFDKYVYALTPAGEIVDLPQGSTPIDFAYHIHSEVGDRCRGAKIKGKIVPLTYALQTGDQVEILTVKEGGPSRDWLSPHLGYVKTARARSKIHQWFRKLDYEQNVHDGQEIIEAELERLGLPPLDYDELAPKLNVGVGDDVLAGVGRGDIRLGHVLTAAQVLLPEAQPPLKRVKTPTKKGHKADEISIQGVGNLLTHIADCCKPVPGDSIVGYVTQGKGVSIHQENCMNALHLMENQGERILSVAWRSDAVRTYPLDIIVYAYDRQGLLNDITRVLANEKVNVTGANTHNEPDGVARMTLSLEISSVTTLERVLARILQLPNIFEAKRYFSGQERKGT